MDGLAEKTEQFTSAQVAARFESLGGGGLDESAWALGCEFGFWQRFHGLEPLSLLRWVSIGLNNLLHAMRSRFVGVDDPEALVVFDVGDFDWSTRQTTYGMLSDHTHISRSEMPREKAQRRMAITMGFLARKLIADLESGDKLFIYRTFDYTPPMAAILDLAAAVRSYGPSTLCFVCRADADNPAFTARRISDTLIIGYIDRFGADTRRPVDNFEGWEATCRAILDVAALSHRLSDGRKLVLDPADEANPITLINVPETTWGFYRIEEASCQLNPTDRDAEPAALKKTIDLAGQTQFEAGVSVDNPLGHPVRFTVELRDDDGHAAFRESVLVKAGERLPVRAHTSALLGRFEIILSTQMSPIAPTRHAVRAHWHNPRFFGVE